MRFFGFEITRAKAQSLTSVSDRGWFNIIRESYPGAWQKNVEVQFESVVAHHAVYACTTLIAADISKLRVKLVELKESGVWVETENSSFSPVLRKPNHYQTRIQFWEAWILSKLQRGNTYVLKGRDERNVVTALYVLDPARVKPLVSTSGDVFYELRRDDLGGVDDTIVVPASEIIHDRFNCLFHPLVGISPLFACGLSATQGLSIQENATRFFKNAARPGGLLLGTGTIDDATAARLKEYWQNNFTGEKAGDIAVLGDGLKYERLAMTSVEAQMIEQLKWTAEVVCSTFHVPPYKIGIGQMPTYSNIQSLNVEYYAQCLQSLIEAAELCLDEGLGLHVEKNRRLGTEFDIEGLLRMDSVTQMEVLDKGVKAGVLAPNEARRVRDLEPVEGGNTPYLQQQNYSLAALAKRDAQDNPFGGTEPRSAPQDEANHSDGDIAPEKAAMLAAIPKAIFKQWKAAA